MQSIYRLYSLVDRYANAIEKLNLDGDELEEYSSVLLHLQNQVERGEPGGKIVNECLAYLSQMAGEPLLQASRVHVQIASTT